MAQADYSAQWRELDALKRRYWGAFLGYIPAGACAMWVDRLLDTEVVLGLTLVGVGAVFVTAGWRLSGWRCPRCGDRFFQRRGRFGVYTNSFARRCMNCGLSRGAAALDQSDAAV